LLEAHLMIVQPERFLDEFAQAVTDVNHCASRGHRASRSFDPIH
jgi:hypothetical protein